jgi:cell cycle sensor histidine kinase DivJ
VKFTPKGGSVDLAVRASGSDMLILVSDTGIGIAEKDLSQVGEPFFQAASSYDRAHEGTGLGLSVVKGLVELHGGTFGIVSRVGEGTRVSIRLPRDPKEAARKNEVSVVERLEPRLTVSETEKVKRSA